MSDFDKRLKGLKDALKKSSSKEETKSIYSMALRASTDMIAGILAGTFLGYLADSYFKISPWCLIAGFFLGTTAGFLNIFRTIHGYGYKPGYSSSKSSVGDKK
jgi:ATP synthase protein I